MDFFSEFKEYIKRESLVTRGDHLLLGVSGGPDSLSMLDLFNRLKDELELKLVVFHLNHCFRQQAEHEAEFVENFCRERRLKIECRKVDVPAVASENGLSPEEAARNVRLDLIKKIMGKHQLQRACLAHNRDDLVETVLFNLFRGTGLRGLKGIEPVSRIRGIRIVHPLLRFTRDMIEEYCQFRGLNPVRDASNEQSLYTRNIIRNQLLPLIEQEINPAVKQAVFRMSSIIGDIDAFLEKQTDEAKKQVIISEKDGKYELALSRLRELSSVIRRRLVHDIYSELVGEPDDFYFKHYQAVDELILNSETGKRLSLQDIHFIRVYEKLIITDKKPALGSAEYCFQLSLPDKVSLPGGNTLMIKVASRREIELQKFFGQSHICCCDYEKIKFPLKVRNRRNGDKIKPLGMEGHRKVKDILIDKKIPVFTRDLIPLVVDNQDNIIWIAGIQMNDRFKVKPETERILIIKLIKQN